MNSSNIDTFDIQSGMKFYLTESVSNSFTIPVNNSIELDLNGYTLTGTVVVQSGAALTISGDYTGDGVNNSDTAGTITPSGTASLGAVYVNGGSFTLKSGTISGCTSTYGGGVYVTNNGTFTLNGGTISGNTATKGGGVYVDNGTFKMVSGTISGNEATSLHGGGVYVSENGSFTMEGGTITENDAGYGAGVYVNGGSFTMTDGTITKHITTGDGGGIYVTNAKTLTLTGGSITENEARYGGGICVYDGTYTLNGSTSITKNEATDGGGIYVKAGSVTLNTTTAISSNDATNGGGFYVAGGTVTLTDGTLTGNTATNGGGVYVNDGAFSITEASITGNSATNNGGGIYVGGGTFTLNATSADQSVTISGNTNDTDTASNVYLSSSSPSITIGGALSGTYTVGVSKYSTINTTEFGFTQGWNTYMSGKDSVFTPDDNSHVITLGTDNELWIDNTSTWLQTQINNSNGTSENPATIALLADTMALNKTITVADGKYVTLTGGTLTDGTLTRAEDFTGIMFTVTGQLTLKDITLDGSADETTSYLVSVDGYDDETYSAQLTLDEDAILKNNGGAAVLVVGDGTLNMKPDSEITGNKGSAVILMHYSGETGGNITMSGGTISGNSALAGSGIYVSASSSLTMTDGAIEDNDAPAANDDGWGGVIDVWIRSSSTPSAVNSVDLTSFDAQAVDVDGDDVSGSITIPSHQSSWGGGIYNLGAVTISGGTITGNQAGLGGGVYNGSSATLKLSGAPSITGNFAADGETANNVHLLGSSKITVNGELTAEAANIGITMQTNGTFTSGWDDDNDANTTFSSDDSDYVVKIKSNELVISAPVDAPTITTNPIDIDTTYGGISGSLTVAATNTTDGATLSYQWYSNTAASTTGGTEVENATGTTYTIPTTSNAGTYYYYCVVTATLYGVSESATSTVATVDVAKIDGSGSVTMADWVHNATASNPVPTSSTNGTGSVSYSYAGRGDTTYEASETKPTDAGTYTVTATFATTTNYKAVTATANFEITQSDVTSTGLSVDDATPTYGDTVTFTVTPTATGTAVATRAAVAPTSGQMALYATINGVETQISTAVDADGDGKYTMTYDTTDKLLAVGTHTITAKYVATANMADYSVTASITISAKSITATVLETDTTATKVYDGDADFEDVVLALTEDADGTTANTVFTDDDVTATADGTRASTNVTGTATFTASEVTLSGDDKGFYSLATTDVTGDVEITTKEINSGMIADIADQAFTGDAITPEPVISWTSGTTTLTLEKGTDFTYSYANNEDAAESTDATPPTVTISAVANGNYADAETKASKTFDITIEDSETEFDDGIDTTVEYGETLTLIAEVGIAPAVNVALGMDSDNVAVNTVGFYLVNSDETETYLGSANVLDESNQPTTGEGTATLVYKTTDKDLIVGNNTIKAYYGGSVNLNDSDSETITVKLEKKEVTATANQTGITKTYDGTDAVKVDGTIADITFTVPVVTDSGDVVTVTADAAYNDADVANGIAINFTNQVDGGTDKGFYDVTLPTVTGDITALSVAETGLTGTATVVEDNVVFAEPSFVATLVEAGIDPVSEAVTEAVTGSVTYSYDSTTDATYAALVEALNDVDFTEENKTAEVTYTFTASGNYTGTKTGTLTLTVTLAEPVYTATSNTITATYDDAVAGTVSISAPETKMEVDGAFVEPTVVKTGVFADESITITYTKDGVEVTPGDAGTYVASVTVGDAKAEVSFTISRKSVTFSISGNSFAAETTPNVVISSNDGLSTDDYTVKYFDSTGAEVTLSNTTPVGIYTVQITVTNSNYKLSGTVASVVVYEGEPEEYNVTFNEMGGGDVSDIADAIAGTVRTLPTPTRENHTFTGWSYNGKIYAAEASFTQPEEDVTMTATWVENTFTVSGTVTDKTSSPVSGATVTLVDGTTDTTDADGEFSFDNVAMGGYDISATNGTVTTTAYVYVSGNTTVDKILLDFTLTTAVEVANDLTTTSADLSKVAEAINTDAYTSGDEVEIKLVVTSANDTTAEEEITKASTDVGYVLDLTVKESIKTTTTTMGGEVVETTTVSNLSETDDLISVTIDLPAEMQGMAYYTVLRYHDYGNGPVVDTLTTTPKNGEYIQPITTTIQDGEGKDVEVVTALTIYAKYFSTYAVTSTATAPSSGGGTSSYTSSVASADNGTVTISGNRNKMNSTVTITATPDDGYEVADVTVTYSSGKEVSVTDNGDGTYSYKQPGASVTVTVTFVEIGASAFFTDVDEDDWFYDAVKWAVENDVTSGKSATSFAPYDINTRAEAVTFLYRAMGEPDHDNACDFTDIAQGSFYYDAVLWAVENGITKGTSDTTFSPDKTCTRAEIITLLWRMMGEPVVDSINPFTDVDADAYYYNAVLWAVGEEITKGTSDTTFSPNKDCTRAEIVTFLYRTLNK